MAPSLNIHKGRGRRRICGGPLACAPHRCGKKRADRLFKAGQLFYMTRK